MSEPRNLKRPLLYTLVASVVLGAVLGIIIVLRNQWDWFEVRVILTTVTVAIASLCGLACDLSRTPRGRNLYPTAGLVMTFLSAIMILIGMWADVDEELYWKATGCVSVFAVATVHVCLLSIARLTGKLSWVFFLIACQVIFGLALLICIVIVGEVDNDGMFRFIAVVSIVDAALTLVIPLLHRLGKTKANREEAMMPLDERNVAAIDEELARLRKRTVELEKLRAEMCGPG